VEVGLRAGVGHQELERARGAADRGGRFRDHGALAGKRERAQRDAIEQALNALSQEYRAPLLLFSYHGFKLAEIAEVLGISEGAVKTRVYRAKDMFLRAYQQSEKE
jgi:RNA polymerase sigma factor (sigma-70 family)